MYWIFAYDDNIGLWETQPPHECKTQSDDLCSTCLSLPMPRLSQCLYSLPTAVTNLCMPGMHGTQNAQASKLPGWLGWGEQVSEMECSLGTSSVAQCVNQDWCSPYICLLTSLVPNVPTSGQKLKSASNENKKGKAGLAPCHPSRCFVLICFSAHPPTPPPTLFTSDEMRHLLRYC